MDAVDRLRAFVSVDVDGLNLGETARPIAPSQVEVLLLQAERLDGEAEQALEDVAVLIEAGALEDADALARSSTFVRALLSAPHEGFERP